MYELFNQTSFPVVIVPGKSRQAAEQITCVIKLSFSFNHFGLLSPLASPEAIILFDSYYENNPQQRSLENVYETMPFKKGSEFYLKAVARTMMSECRVLAVDVEVQKEKFKLKKELVIFGRRKWRRNLLGFSISKSEIFTELPVQYEHAFGGVDKNNSQLHYLANPVGMGFCNSMWRCHGVALPKIEYRHSLLSFPTQKPLPASLMAMPSNYSPRLDYWLNRKVLQDIPEDLYNVAPVDQRFDAPFYGNEIFWLPGCLFENRQNVVIKVPKIKINAQLLSDNLVQGYTFKFDTVSMDCERRRFSLVGRSEIPWNSSVNATGKIICWCG